jgi:hypothetical protein
MRTALVLAPAAGGGAHAQPPAKVGVCAQSTVVRIGTRFSPKLVKPILTPSFRRKQG